MEKYSGLYAALERFGAATFRRIDAAYTRAWRLRPAQASGEADWPAVPGAFVVGDRSGSVAVCTLTSNALAPLVAALPGVAIAGRLYTCNLGIEKIVTNVVANPRICALLLCGKESPLFQPAQALRALVGSGVDADRRINGAEGYLPVLSGTTADAVQRFRSQVTLIDRTGETEMPGIEAEVRRLVAEFPASSGAPAPAAIARPEQAQPSNEGAQFKTLFPGGKREPLAYDPKGFIVIDVERDAGKIVARHYLPGGSPANIMRGRSAEGIVLALVREGLVTQLSHAAYLGAEFEKAETALRFGLGYEQDKPLARER